MKHRALSMLLALLMVVSLLPIAAVAGNEEANFTMRLQGGTYNASYSLFADTYEGVRFEVYDESENRPRQLTVNDTLTYDGKVVTSVVYDSNNDSDNTWRVTIAEPESGEQSGWIEYSGKRISIDLRLKHGEKVESFVGKTADEELATPFEWNGQTYYLGVSDGEDVRPFGSGSCELQNENSRNGFMFKAQVFTLNDEDNYVRVSDDVRAGIDKDYNIFVKVWPTESCVGYYRPLVETLQDGSLNCQFTTASLGTWLIEVTAIPHGDKSGFTHYSQLTVSYRETQANGVLGMSYDGSGFVKSYELFAGIHRNIEFKVGNEPLNFSAIREDAPANEKLTYGGLVKQLDFEGMGIWAITLDEPTDNETTGWIQYGTNENNRVTITVKPSHGGAVDKNDPKTKIYKQESDEFKWASWGTAFPFKWHDETYYLGTAEWKPTINQMASPYAGQRGVNEAEAFYAACVFELKSGEAGNGNATYALREDIRKAMMEEDYRFELTLVPTDIGCEYYPIMETVQKTVIWDESSGENGRLTSEWRGQKFSKDSVGIWVYDARIIDPNGEQLQQNLSCCKYSYTTRTEVRLEGNNIEGINQQIRDAIGNGSGQAGNGLYDGMITFILPSGELKGQIVIPKTDYMITVYGKVLENGSITTTLRGGIRFDNDNTNHVGYIHFIGAGKDKIWANEEKTILNQAISGIGQGAPENCVFEEYDIAIHSSTRLSWGSQNSIYLNNNVAICQNSTNGGQPFMRNNWFVGNAIAVMLKEVPGVGNLRTFQNRFVNNEMDFCNETGKPFDSKTESVLWVSENFFYHDSSWQPQKSDLWSEKNGVIYLNYNREGMLLVPNAPSFDETGDYKDDIEAYKAFLPRFGGWTPVYAYPLARTQFCDTFFYPNRRDPSYCPQWWPDSDPYYPSYVRQGSTISTSELDGLRFSSYDSETDTAVGTFEFSASAAETEN